MLTKIGSALQRVAIRVWAFTLDAVLEDATKGVRSYRRRVRKVKAKLANAPQEKVTALKREIFRLKKADQIERWHVKVLRMRQKTGVPFSGPCATA